MESLRRLRGLIAPEPGTLGRLVFYLAVGVAAMAFHGCVEAPDPAPATPSAGTFPSPDSSAEEGGSRQVLAGKELFDANCAQCHGPGAAGTDLGPPLLHQVYLPYHHSDAAFHSAVRNGVPMHHWFFGDMPPVSGLSADQVESITCYVRQAQFETGMTQARAC